MSTPARPGLKFSSIDEMVADAANLCAGPCDKAGQWDLGMILDHLTKTMSGPFVPGQKNLPWPAGAITRFMLRQLVKRETYPPMKFPAPASIRPVPGVDVEAARSAFVAAAEKVKAASGETINCPPFGTIPLAGFRKLQLLHGAHHLSFLKRREEI